MWGSSAHSPGRRCIGRCCGSELGPPLVLAASCRRGRQLPRANLPCRHPSIGQMSAGSIIWSRSSTRRIVAVATLCLPSGCSQLGTRSGKMIRLLCRGPSAFHSIAPSITKAARVDTASSWQSGQVMLACYQPHACATTLVDLASSSVTLRSWGASASAPLTIGMLAHTTAIAMRKRSKKNSTAMALWQLVSSLTRTSCITPTASSNPPTPKVRLDLASGNRWTMACY
mmetsp:Transcript_44014/g.79139  ORF Transcript_44014/g.79139 Transcript_44014/m.79139 type:complete len:228 (-) Transcript_44014:390-1073(-)